VSRLHELTEKIDAFFARVEARHPADMECRTGCSDCCHVRLTITTVEAESIRALVASWPAERRAALGAIVASVAPNRCAALDAAGRCSIYEARPVVCRSHGVPVRLGTSLPVVCHRNFTREGPAAADPDCILDQKTVSAILLAVNDGDDRRIDLAALIRELC
jgi:Fe-S-cluster containining protein